MPAAEHEAATDSCTLPLGRYRLRLLARERIVLPEYSGSTWRGLLGHGLRRTVCVTRQPTCTGCLLLRTCAYPYVFETPVPEAAAKLARYPSAPHPFVLAPPDDSARVLETGATIDLGLTLCGRANAHLPYLIQAFVFAGESGVGRARAEFEIAEVKQEPIVGSDAWQTIYRTGDGLQPLPPRIPEPPAAPESCAIELLTPLRVKRDDALVGPDRFEFHDLYRALLRRLSLLTYFHGEHPLELDFRAFVAAARTIPIGDTELRWHEWTRYSSRQRTTMQMGGLVGRFGLVRPAEMAAMSWPNIWRQLWLGQWTHAGKGTSMGLGRYRLTDASLRSGTTSPIA